MHKELVKMAFAARENAYVPYSGFKVGVALLTSDGDVFTGCNIENSSFGATVCAERVAIFNAVSQGERNFRKIAVTAVPCGVCRQVMAEFCDGDFEIIVAEDTENYRVWKLSEILPEAFILPKED